MLALITEVRDFEARIEANSERLRGKFEARGQLLPRARLGHLLDRGGGFVELSRLAGYRMHDDDGERNIAGGNVITGVGRVSGTDCLILVNDSGIRGGAYLPGLSDYVIMVRGRAKVFLAGPPLLKAATGEAATDEELGGADMHATISGTAEYSAEDDAQAIAIARDLVGRLDRPPEDGAAPGDDYDEPAHDIDDLLGIVPVDYRVHYDCHEVIARLVDGSDFLEF